MKTKHFILIVTFIVPFLLVGCSKEPIEPVTELPIDGSQKVIKVEKNGIGIEFCLLNEQGEPATVFKQGENFKFHLVIANNLQTDTAVYIIDNFLGNPELFNVFKEDGSLIGKPLKLTSCLYIGDEINKIYKGERWILESPWRYDSNNDTSAVRFLQCYFKVLNPLFLGTGKYYTKLTQKFCLGRYLPNLQQEEVCIDTLKLKIHFEIQ